MTYAKNRLRFEIPLYTIAEAARIVDVPASTLTTWAQGYVRRFPDRPDVVGDPIVTYLEPNGPRRPSIPFVGLTEVTVLAAVRRSGVPMQRIRPALRALETGLSLEHALASKSLYTDGRTVVRLCRAHSDTRRAVRLSNWSWFGAARTTPNIEGI